MSVNALILKIYFLDTFLFNIDARDEITGQIFSFSLSGTILYSHRITESQNGRGWKGPLWVI